jgi:large subunit ribosomal protein L15
MQLNTLPKSTSTAKRRLGQGHGSGRVKTSGRGTKGQKARGDIPLRFEGGALPLTKRLPFLRGKQKNKPFRADPIVLHVSDLNALPAKSTVDVALLIKHNLVGAREVKRGVKILSDGDLTVALTVGVPVSKKAAEKIQKAGGTISETS